MVHYLASLRMTVVVGIELNNKYKVLAQGLIYYQHSVDVSSHYGLVSLTMSVMLHMKNWPESGI